MAEMYIHGAATREITAILEKMCGMEVSAMQVSRATETLDAYFNHDFSISRIRFTPSFILSRSYRQR